MSNQNIESISTGGGCEHYYIKYPEFKLAVLINDENQKPPQDGAPFDIGIYQLEKDGSMGQPIRSDYYDTLDNFELHTVYDRILGYLEGKGFPKIALSPGFTGQIHFERATDLYLWLDENEIMCPVTIQLHLEN